MSLTFQSLDGVSHGVRQLVTPFRQAVATRLAEERAANDDGQAPLAFADERKRAEEVINYELDRYAHEQIAAGASTLTEDEEEWLAQAVVDAMFGLGRLQPLLDDESIENININGADNVWVKRVGGKKERMEPVADSDEELIDLMRHAAFHLGPSERRFDHGSPQLDMQLRQGGHRLSAVMSVSARPAISIRRHRMLDEENATLDRLVELGAIDRHLQSFLRAAVKARKTMVIAGGTNAGKTTLLRALANEIPPHERLVTIEKALELGLDQFKQLHPDVVALEAREANTEGEGAIEMTQLVRRGLRMDPDRVIVGEVLGDEVIDMLNAMSQGNDGSLCTIHANSSDYVFKRICSYAIQSAERLPTEATNLLIAGAIDFVVFIDQTDRGPQGGGLLRFVSSVREVVGAEGREVNSLEVFEPASRKGRPAVPAEQPTCLEDLKRQGYDPAAFHSKRAAQARARRTA